MLKGDDQWLYPTTGDEYDHLCIKALTERKATCALSWSKEAATKSVEPVT